MSGNSARDASRRGSVEDALASLRQGDPVLVHDSSDREGETDLIYPAGSVTPEAVARLRNDAGGLIAVALGADVADAFGLPYLHNVIDHPANDLKDIQYDDHPSFSLTVNHRETFTGVTDNDRSRTITALAAAATDPSETEFADAFRSPGHVHLLRAAPDLAARRGHTELAVALAEAAGLPPVAVVCEMLDGETGDALAPGDAEEYARRNGYVYVEGRDVITVLG